MRRPLSLAAILVCEACLAHPTASLAQLPPDQTPGHVQLPSTQPEARGTAQGQLQSEANFQSLFPRWPGIEVPIGHITNGVHVPSWDSVDADRVWTAACGKERWRALPDGLTPSIECVADDALWAMRGDSRQRLVRVVRNRLKRQLAEAGYPPAIVGLAESVLDPNVLTLGFARRFTAYKRPILLLEDQTRLERLLNNKDCPVQIVIAGKAHPDDEEGKKMVQDWIIFSQRPECRHRVVFLEDYDISLAQELVQGVDVWINTPRRCWEACGTSGMKVLVNGGLNLSVLDGWWAEAYAPGLGWAIEEHGEQEEGAQDRADAVELQDVLEHRVVPEFYDRDASGLPRAWIARMRRSMASLAPQYAGTRLVREYLSKAYLPAAGAIRQRLDPEAQTAKKIAAWETRVRSCWGTLHLGNPQVVQEGNSRKVSVPVYLGEMPADDIRVEFYADPVDGGAPEIVELERDRPIAGAANSYVYAGQLPTSRSSNDFTARIVPCLAGVRVPAEIPLIVWQR